MDTGILYLCATPIGNLDDITVRCLNTLKECDMVACEDTRHSLKLLNHFGISKPLTSYYEHNKKEKGEYIVSELKSGKSVALVTDAGTPAISDPGEQLVALCREKGLNVVPIPGACAFVTALSASGFDSRRFTFEGFLPPEKKDRREVLDYYKSDKKTVIFYEAPHKLKDTAKEIYEALGDRRICVAREITKMNEEIVTYTLSEFVKVLEEKEPRGEYVLIVEGAKASETAFFENMSIEEHVEFYENQGLSRMDAIKACARDRHVPKNAIYKELV